MPESQDSRARRMPSVEKRISGLGPGDMRVSITGTVVDMQGGRIVLDDGSGRVSVGFDSPPDAKPDQFVRVFGRVVPAEGGTEIEGEILQDMEGLDKDLFKKINSLKLDKDDESR
jgi:hypothetical protein